LLIECDIFKQITNYNVVFADSEEHGFGGMSTCAPHATSC